MTCGSKVKLFTVTSVSQSIIRRQDGELTRFKQKDKNTIDYREIGRMFSQFIQQTPSLFFIFRFLWHHSDQYQSDLIQSWLINSFKYAGLIFINSHGPLALCSRFATVYSGELWNDETWLLASLMPWKWLALILSIIDLVYYYSTAPLSSLISVFSLIYIIRCNNLDYPPIC